jgi:hypothetical protein
MPNFMLSSLHFIYKAPETQAMQNVALQRPNMDENW